MCLLPHHLLCPRPLGGALSDNARLTSDVCLTTSVAYIQPAGWDGAYWLIGPSSAGLAQGCRCALPLQGAGEYCGVLPYSLFVQIKQRGKTCALCGMQIHADTKGKVTALDDITL